MRLKVTRSKNASLYHKLGLDAICQAIAERHQFSYPLDSILSRLLYGRILFPGSKLSTFHLASTFLEPPDFEIQHVYRSLEVIAREGDFIQSELYQNSLKVSKRNTGILYYKNRQMKKIFKDTKS